MHLNGKRKLFEIKALKLETRTAFILVIVIVMEIAKTKASF